MRTRMHGTPTGRPDYSCCPTNSVKAQKAMDNRLLDTIFCNIILKKIDTQPGTRCVATESCSATDINLSSPITLHTQQHCVHEDFNVQHRHTEHYHFGCFQLINFPQLRQTRPNLPKVSRGKALGTGGASCINWPRQGRFLQNIQQMCNGQDMKTCVSNTAEKNS